MGAVSSPEVWPLCDAHSPARRLRFAEFLDGGAEGVFGFVKGAVAHGFEESGDGFRFHFLRPSRNEDEGVDGDAFGQRCMIFEAFVGDEEGADVGLGESGLCCEVRDAVGAGQAGAVGQDGEAWGVGGGEFGEHGCEGSRECQQ